MEADDVIGTLAIKSVDAGYKVRAKERRVVSFFFF